MSTGTDSLAPRFEQAFAPLVAGGGLGHGGMRRCRDAAEAAEWIAGVLRPHGARRILAACRPHLAPVVEPLQAQFEVQTVEPDRALPPQAVAAFDVGLGGGDLLIAETASILLLRSGHEPRTLSLLPRIHVVVASARALVPRLSDALKLVPGAADFVLVTGPSRTADVEKTLVVPAHGPGWLYVALLD